MKLILLILLATLALSKVDKSSLECKDSSKECTSIKNRCGDQRHSWLMELKCPKTCNSCKKIGENCKDVYNNCDEYLDKCKNGVCAIY
jgi:hypothetical protein